MFQAFSSFKFYLFPLFLLLYSASFGQAGNEVVEFKTSLKVKNSKLVEEKSFLIQINNKESDWISDIEIQYSKGDKLEILEASIINYLGVTVRKLKKKEIITRSDISYGTFFEDSMVKEFTLKWNEYPYIIKYSYRKIYEEFLYVSRWYPSFFSNVPTRKASLQVEFPLDYEVKLDYPDSIQHNSIKLQNSHRHYWEVNNITTFNRELFSPPHQELIPSVTIVPKNFMYEIKGSFETWATFGNWIMQINNQLDILPEDEKQKVDKLVAGIEDKKEIVKVLYHYLQDNTRYINVAIDIGGLKPYPASYVSDKKYGDCKALTIYMKALLKHVNIPSYYTIIEAGSNATRINRNLPGQQFNHVILNVPFNRDTLWLENTANYFPFGYLGTFTHNRYGLLIDGKNSRLIKTPILELHDVLQQSKHDFNLTKDGKGIVTVSKNLRGYQFEEYKYIKSMLSRKEQQQQIKKRISIKDSELVSSEITHNNRDDSVIKIDLKLTVKNQLRKLGNMIVLKVLPLKMFDFKSPEVRKTPVRINYPIYTTDSVVYNLPFMDRYEVKLPDDVKIESEYGKYMVQYAINNNQIIILRELKLYNNSYSLIAYKKFYSFIVSIRQSQQKATIILNQL